MTTVFNPKKKRHGNQQVDALSSLMIHQGVTLSQATTIFKMDMRDIKSKIEGRVRPCGDRNQNPIYQIRELAPYLVRPAYDIDEFIARMTVMDLPPMVRKEFWAARRSQQEFEIKAGELWRTDEVIDLMAGLLSNLRMDMLLIREAIERETDVTPKQRQIFTTKIDTSLETLHAKATSFLTARKSADQADIPSAETDDSEDI